MLQGIVSPFRKIGFRRSLVFAYDLVTIGVAFGLAFLVRFDFKIPPEQIVNLKNGLPIVYAIQTAVFISQGLYRGLWSFASLQDLFTIIKSVALGVGATVASIAILYNRLLNWPRSAFILDAIFLIMILGGGRFAYRFTREVLIQGRRAKRRILVVGAGQSANQIAREFLMRKELAAKILGYLDDNPKLHGYRIQGASVLGSVEHIGRYLDSHRPTEVIIAIPSLPGGKLKPILESCQLRSIPCRICPPVRDVLLGRVELNQLREIRVEDLLRRDVAMVDDPGLTALLSGKSVLVTGAGGSIGSELCRQILAFKPKRLTLLERAEYNLYRLDAELARKDTSGAKRFPETEIFSRVGDVLDAERLEEVLEEAQPEIVLHAAAYKHVPLMEENIGQCLKNNVLGSYRTAMACAKAGVQKFVLVSTDKAVRPTNVMGATKRMAELVTHAIGARSKMTTIAVRFGNVLDSEGSVLPKFKEQIAMGGPVTVTHPDIRRYFMTIPEASLLVLESVLLGKGGEVFLLDMGEPVLIRELAEDVIRLSGLKPYQDIEIVFTGLRRGEKLYEELLINIDGAQGTGHPKILVSTHEHASKNIPQDWEAQVQQFEKLAAGLSPASLCEVLQSWVPEYKTPVLGGPSESVDSNEDSESNPSWVH